MTLGGIVLWQELELVLAELREVVGQLVKTPATEVPDLRAKAAVLATLLRHNEDTSGPVIPEDDISALALSLTADIGGLSGSPMRFPKPGGGTERQHGVLFRS